MKESQAKEIRIAEIKIIIGSQEVHLTVEEAKRLLQALQELLSENDAKEEHHYHWHTSPLPTSPLYPITSPWTLTI